MTSLVLVPWAETAWSAAGRMMGRTPLPLTETGRLQVGQWAESLTPYVITQVFSSDEQAAAETAAILATKLGATQKTVMDFAEVDPGLWDGLTLDELKRRYAKVFKKWSQDPSSVCPPDGEDLSDASNRIVGAVERVLRKNAAPAKAIVLGPVAFALAKCWVEGADFKEVRETPASSPVHYDQEALAMSVGADKGRGSNRASADASLQKEAPNTNGDEGG